MRNTRVLLGAICIAATGLSTPACAQDITYQGELIKSGQLVDGTADLVFRLYDAAAGGTQVGASQTVLDEHIANGRFTVQLNFGAGVFEGGDRWVEIDVRAPAGTGSYVTLGQRQPLTAAPVALYALEADTPWQTNGTAVYYDEGRVGIGTTAPAYALDVFADGQRAIFAYNGLPTGTSYALYATATGTSANAVLGTATSSTGTTYGVVGRSSSTSGYGVYGFAAASTGTNYGVYGRTASTTGHGVYGLANAATGTTYGVYGESSSSTGFGVVGVGQADSGFNYGVYGRADGDFGVGVHGWAGHASGPTRAIYGKVESAGGYAGYFEGGKNYFEGNVGIGIDPGVYPLRISTDRDYGCVISATNRYASPLLKVVNYDDTGSTYGIQSEIHTPFGSAIFGFAAAGRSNGVYGHSVGDDSAGVWGICEGAGYGVLGRCGNAAGYDFYASGVGMDYGSSSSIRWKRNIAPIDDPLGKLGRLRGVYFDWDAEHGGHHAVGMIAEEVGAVLPEIVNYEANGVDAVGMDYSKLSPLLVEAVNELRADKDAEIAALQDRVAELELLVGELIALQQRESAK